MNSSKNTPAPQTIPSMAGPLLWMVVSIIYLISPIDVIPDIPVIGHVDDVLFNLITTLNLVQAYTAQSSKTLADILRMIKIGLIILSILLVAVIGLFGYAIVKSF